MTRSLVVWCPDWPVVTALKAAGRPTSRAAAVFVALNTGYAMLLLPSGAQCGRELGILNLANTLPQVVAPLLAWRSTEAHGFGVGLMILAALALTAGLLPLLLNDDQRR